MCLARTWHGPEGNGHPPVGVRNALPGPFTELLCRVIPFVMATVEVDEPVHY